MNVERIDTTRLVFDSRGLNELLLKIRAIKHLFFIKIVNE
jgi:hypothetical protein